MNNEDAFCHYIILNHKQDVLRIMEQEAKMQHFSLEVKFVKLHENLPDIGNKILLSPIDTLNNCNKSVKTAQQMLLDGSENAETLCVKDNVHVRISGLPDYPEFHRTVFPKNQDLGYFLRISGTVIRMTASKMLEYQRRLVCAKCKYEIVVEADYEKKFAFDMPKFCPSPTGCNGSNFTKMENKLQYMDCKDYQELKLQEQLSSLKIGCIPSTMWVTLEDDLVDSCQPGDDVSVSGIVMRRFSTVTIGKRPDIELVLRANHVQVYNEQRSTTSVTADNRTFFDSFWKEKQPLLARNILLDSFCPQIFGMTLAKLAVALVLAGGTQSEDRHVRTEPHLLFVGDPGTGKSQLIRWAAKLMPRSVLTTGIGSTAAGLTVTAVMEDGHWQLEAGALVLADGGICCIDEFNSMREHDRASIHEAMEQQTISVAKASMVCKLNTKCSILAAANFKSTYDISQPIGIGVGIAGPLLSRFDLILVMRDSINEDWDRVISDHILDCPTLNPIHKEVWPFPTLQAYFIVVKGLKPVLTPEANEILRKYYQHQRQIVLRNAARTTVRLLDSLIRLSQAHAKLMFREEVTAMDAIMAVYLMDISNSLDPDALRKESKDPIGEYCHVVTTMLEKLGLNEILENEMLNIQNTHIKREPI